MSNAVPVGWRQYRIADVLRQEKVKFEMNDDESYPLLSVRRRNGGFFHRETLKGRQILTKTLTKAIPESFVISKMQVVHGACGVIEEPFYDGYLSASYVSFLSKDNRVHIPYFNYLCHTPLMYRLFLLSSHGVHIEKMTFDVNDWLKKKVVLPPFPEQQKVAAILSSVDDVIEKTRAQIDKLKDLKTGMMQELLTKGIGSGGVPHTEFKDSPLGRIPKAWSLIELGKVLTGIDSGWSPSCGDRSPGTSEWGVLKVSAVTRGEFLESESKTLPEHLAPREKIQVHKGDVLLTRANGVAELVGKCVIVRREPQAKLMMSDKILRLKPTEKLFNEFLLHVFNARSTRKQIELCWGGSSGQKNIGQADIRNFIIPLPSLEEQKIIAKSITQIDHTLYHKNRKLQSLIGSKKALMQDLLTGKVRVKVDQKESAVA